MFMQLSRSSQLVFPWRKFERLLRNRNVYFRKGKEKHIALVYRFLLKLFLQPFLELNSQQYPRLKEQQKHCMDTKIVPQLAKNIGSCNVLRISLGFIFLLFLHGQSSKKQQLIHSDWSVKNTSSVLSQTLTSRL